MQSGEVITDLKVSKRFVLELVAGEVWITVFATSMGKTAVQNCQENDDINYMLLCMHH